jgi:hypothetical protein
MNDVSSAAFQNGTTTANFTNTTTPENITYDFNSTSGYITSHIDTTSDNGYTTDNVTSVVTAYDNATFDEVTRGNATLTSGGSTPFTNYTAGQRILSSLADTMAQHDVTPSSQSATTVVHNEDKVALVTDIQFHFIIVGALFIVVIILALINLYIHFRSGGSSRSFIGMQMVGSGRGGGGGLRRGGYTVKMTAKPSVFI